jgi:hypothetical protein
VATPLRMKAGAVSSEIGVEFAGVIQ